MRGAVFSASSFNAFRKTLAHRRPTSSIGGSFLQEKRFSSAAAAFQRLLDTFPSSPEVPEAKVQLSSAFVQLRFCTDARSLLRDVVKRYPRSPPAAEARRELDVVEHLPKADCTS